MPHFGAAGHPLVGPATVRRSPIWRTHPSDAAAGPSRPYGHAMQIGRRSLLGLGAAAVISAATGCNAPSDDPAVTGPVSAPTPSTPPPATGFPGQPRPGTMYYGASVPYGRSLQVWEAELETTLALHRSFFKPDDDETTQLIHRCRLRPGARPAPARLVQAHLAVERDRGRRPRRLARRAARRARRPVGARHLHPPPRAGERRPPGGAAAVRLRRHAAPPARAGRDLGAGADRRAHPAALDVRPAAHRHRPDGVAGPRGAGHGTRHLQPVGRRQRQGVALASAARWTR